MYKSPIDLQKGKEKSGKINYIITTTYFEFKDIIDLVQATTTLIR
jgi:hypothetical protein